MRTAEKTAAKFPGASYRAPQWAARGPISGLNRVLGERLWAGQGCPSVSGSAEKPDWATMHVVITYSTDFPCDFPRERYMESDVTSSCSSQMKNFTLLPSWKCTSILRLSSSMIEYQALFRGSSLSCCRRLKNVSHFRHESARGSSGLSSGEDLSDVFQREGVLGSRGSSMACSRRLKSLTISAT